MPTHNPVRNVLYIMVDQMRADCLGIAGHPVVRTPSLDWLASRGARFSNAFVQTPVCGPSRACFHTGRYTHAHRSYWNNVALPLDERTLAEYVAEAGIRAALCGKTHHTPDTATAERLARRAPVSEELLLTNAGFEPWEVNDFWGDGWLEHLRKRGYDLPFEEPAMAPFLVEAPDGSRKNGWRFENSRLPTVVKEEDSDTAFMTRRAMEFIEDAGEDRWLLHLSYVKPHWPNVAPAPYNDMYDPSDVPAPIRLVEELNGHPLLPPFRTERRSLPFDDERVWRENRATYYGLITQIDAHLGKLFGFLNERGQLDDTLIIFVSDHGEYMGDHWLFEKEHFYESSIRVPLIIYDPRPDAGRGLIVDDFVESVDMLPTILEALGIPVLPEVQGRSVLQFVRGADDPEWRSAVFGDWDFRFHHFAEAMGIPSDRCRAWMVRTEKHKYVHFNGFPSLLFDLESDPNELKNLAEDPTYQGVVQQCQKLLIEWRQSTEDDSRGARRMEDVGRAGTTWVTEMQSRE